MRTQADFDEERVFEEEVRRICRALWPSYMQTGATKLSHLECDGYYETEECIHLLECTVSRTLEKARKDVEKLDRAAGALRADRTDKGVKTWFITRFDPTADQMGVIRASASAVSGLSFADFQSRLVDVGAYLDCRMKHRFGSVDHPAGGAASDVEYIEIPILSSKTAEEFGVERIANGLLAGERFTLLGDYGIGKSMTLREVFRFLRNRYLYRHTASFPIYINLREHHGQQNPSEILERHARDIGYPVPSHLVRAWKAGNAVLLLDGFDEIASAGIQFEWRKLRETRSTALTGLRRLIFDSPSGCGIAVAGRNSFFDSDTERSSALSDGSFRVLLLHEFTEGQVRKFFESVKFEGTIPPWLPSRPLLLSTLFWLYSQGVRRGAPSLPSDLPTDPSKGWQALVDAISEREAKIEAQVDGQTIKRILEMLATKARSKPSGLGPLNSLEITDSFQKITGMPPSLQALSVLQRLPGLGTEAGSEDGQRSFLDEDLVDALASADVYRILVDPYSAKGDEEVLAVKKSLGLVGFGILSEKLESAAFDHRRIVRTFMEFEQRRWCVGVLADLLIYALETDNVDQLRAKFKDLHFEQIVLQGVNLSKVTFEKCIIGKLVISAQHEQDHLPVFDDCLIEFLQGVFSQDDLLREKFQSTKVEHYVDDGNTNASILRSEMPVRFRVLLTILRKLFVQGLSGRQLAALKRGLDSKEQNVVPDILDSLFRERIVEQYKAANGLVIVPVRKMKRRVMAILTAPFSSTDSLVLEFRKFD